MPLRSTFVGLALDVWALVASRYRMSRQPASVEIHGVRIEVDPSWPENVRNALYCGAYESAEASVLRRTLLPGDRFFEVGASSGVITTLACAIVGDANVTAYEANPALIPVAVRTAARNGFRPKVVNAVLSRDGQARQFFPGRSPLEGSLIPLPDVRPETIPGASFIEALRETKATYLMVDIEGGETELLMLPLPASVRAICVEVHPDVVGPESVQNLLRHLMDEGFVIDSRVWSTQVAFLDRLGSGRQQDQPARKAGADSVRVR